nr:TRAP transporter small permease [uncultured Oscillibacter sp.]
MSAFRKVIDFLYKVIMYTVSIALGIMIIVAFVEVIRRYLLGKSFIWADDLIRYMIIYVGFIGGAAAYKDNNLASLDLLTRHFSQKVQIILEIVVNTIVTATIIFLLYYSALAVSAPSIKYSVGVGLKIALWIPYLALPVGFAVMLLFSVEKYIDMFKRLRKGGSGEECS